MAVAIAMAHPRDAEAIARLHAENWQTYYRDILPDDYFARDAVQERITYWTEALPAGDYPLVLIARKADEPVGFIAIRLGCDEGYDATIEHLHVVPSSQGSGLGRRMVAEAAERLMRGGVTSVCLWVFEANSAAIGFYESLGGVTDAFGTDKFAGGDAPDRRIGWRDLPALLRACQGSGGP